jgi:hypothetical protein
MKQPSKRYYFFIGCSLIFISLPANAAASYGFNITLDGNQFFNQVKNTIVELVQAFTDANKPGAFAGSQLDIFDTPSDFRFNLSGISAVSKDENYGLNYSGENWKTSGSLRVEKNKNCSGAAIPNCSINIFPPTLVDSETALLKVVSAQVVHFNNAPIDQLEGINHGIPPILPLGPINFQAADFFIPQNGGFRTVNKYGIFGKCDTHRPHYDCADAFFDQISLQRTPVGAFPEIVNDADYEINGFTYTVRATHTVPAPLPFLGIGVAFSYARKIRRKLRSVK